MTTGTNTPDTLSAILAIGAFEAAASLTMLMILDNAVSLPTCVALHFKYPDWFMVAADTRLPLLLSTGMLSPESVDSSTAESPSSTIPSTGMLSPGFTTNISPTATSSMPTATSAPSLMRTAVLGARSIRPFKASVVRPLEYASSVFPTVIRASIMAADSK